MANTYVDYVLAEARWQGPSLGPSRSGFVAIGYQMWTIWQTVLRFRHGYHREPTAISAPVEYPENLCSYSHSAHLDTGQKISTAKWIPGKSDPFTNPWFDVANFIPTADGVDRQAPGFPFTSLPPELVVHVVRFLPGEAAVALALSSKTMYNLIGRRPSRSLSVREHWNLILLLERDSDTLVACHECMKLHGPFAPIHQPRVFLPGGITPAFSRIVAKHCVRQRPHAELLDAINRTTVHTLLDFKLYSTLSSRTIAGNLFLRQETFIAPMISGGMLTGRSAYLLNEILDGKDSNVCPHVRWQHLGLELSRSPNSGSDYPSSLSVSYLRSQLSRVDYLGDRLHERFRDCPFRKMDRQRLLEFQADERYATADQGMPCRSALELGRRFHSAPGCYDSTPVPYAVLKDALGLGLNCALLHHQPCSDVNCDGLPTRLRVNLVRSCEICETDMCIGSRDVEGVGRMISLTTWKNLGGVYDGAWRSWYSHYSDVEVFASRFLVNPDDTIILRDLKLGPAVYRAWEGIPAGLPEPRDSWYTMSISPEVLAAFTEPPGTPESRWWRLPKTGSSAL
ncbi:hypothetical protein B0J18DRAFT_485576 [Chaetomium sp. MPI-SDFR-AT-0129]|nr:hypothetical protein B0J18DRAFT_485576 [Chaetomium sp. MPI-SDFR-AT-0129]